MSQIKTKFLENSAVTTAKIANTAVDETKLSASVAGDGLTGGAGTALAVGAGDAITVTANAVAVDATALAGTGIENDGSNNLRISAAAAGDGLTGGAGSALAVGAGSGITVSANDVAVDNTVIRTNGANAFSADQSMGGNKLTNVATPTASGDAANKQYVDSLAAGLDPKASTRAATTGALPAATYNNGTGGVGATLTGDLFAELPDQDGTTLIIGDRLLVKNQAAALQNGIYVVTDLGDGVAQGFILTRATDQDGSPANEVSGGNFTFIETGSTNEGTGWVVIWDGDITVGTDPIDWTQYSDTGSAVVSVNGETGIVILDTGDIAENGNLYFTDERAQDAVGTILDATATITLSYDDGTPGITADVNAASISETHLTASVAGAGLTGGAGTALAVGAGDGITVNANDVAVNTTAIAGTGLENDGSNNLRISAAAAGAGLTGGAGAALAVGAGDGITVNADDIAVNTTAIAGAGLENDGSNNLRIRVDASTVKINGSNNLEALKKNDELIALDATDITNQYVDLGFAAHSAESISLTVIGGIMQERGTDFTVALTGGAGGVTRITFDGDLETGGNAALVDGDKLVVSYAYLT